MPFKDRASYARGLRRTSGGGCSKAPVSLLLIPRFSEVWFTQCCPWPKHVDREAQRQCKMVWQWAHVKGMGETGRDLETHLARCPGVCLRVHL